MKVIIDDFLGRFVTCMFVGDCKEGGVRIELMAMS